jgi:septal ring factor EnvC (AmiA/AmiB activator)
MYPIEGRQIMSITVNSYVFLLLLAVIPAVIVLTVCMLRIETIRGDAKAAGKSMESMIEHYARIVAQHNDINDRLSTLSAGLHESGLRIANLDESITSTNNKLASRDRADRIADLRKRKEDAEIAGPGAEIPGTKQQVIDFAKIPGAIPLQPQSAVKRDREIGEYPEEWFNGMA